jgi:hypothetical protein
MPPTSADNLIRIGPRKLCRVIRYATDSTTTRQPSEFGSRSSRVHELSPTIIKGDTSPRKMTSRNQESYFELPRDGKAAKRSSLLTPMAFMQASLADVPDGPVSVDSQQDASAEQPASNPDRVRRDLILLVEDNSLNMRVSLHICCDSQYCHHDLQTFSMTGIVHSTLLSDCIGRSTTTDLRIPRKGFTSIC